MDTVRTAPRAIAAAADDPNADTVTLCGSTRFKAAYIDWYQRLTDQGFIVLTVGRFLPKRDHGSALKADLDQLHLRKIDRSARIFVLDVGGYIGDSTRREIAHAESTGKTVVYLSQVFPEYVEPPLASTDIALALESEWKAALADCCDWFDRSTGPGGADYLNGDDRPRGQDGWADGAKIFAVARALTPKPGEKP